MFHKQKEFLISLITSRVLYLLVIFIALACVLIHRVFVLQIVEGENYLNSFELKTKKERSIDAARGNIYDRNGVLLAYNKLAYCVKIEDVFESGKSKNDHLNNTILRTIAIIEENNDKLSTEFNITVDEYNKYQYTVSGSRLSRFKADVYGLKLADEMTYAQSSSTAEEMMSYLAGEERFNVNALGLDKKTTLKIVAIRYALSLNSYQKYIATTISTNVSPKTVAIIMENSDVLQGVSIAEDTIRVYPTAQYTSQIIGYTGKVSSEELEELQKSDETYAASDIVGKVGIEASQESILHGKKGSETVFVDTMGKVISIEDHVDPNSGNNLYLTIDSNLQEAVYHILEQKLAGLILKKLINAKEYIPAENSTTADIMIPIYNVYISLFDNGVIDINHLNSDEATEDEKTAYLAFTSKKNDVLERLHNELTDKNTAYKKLSVEWQVYENYVEDILLNEGILVDALIDSSDEVYKSWAIDEVISLGEYIKYAISQNWIDTSILRLEDPYSESEEIFSKILEIIDDRLAHNDAFDKIVYKYVVKEDRIKPRVICNILIDQGIVELSDEYLNSWYSGRITPYSFMIDRITNLEITPAQLALDPYSASCVITDVNTGDVLAIVSYPSYDNNYLANGADSAYLKKINADHSTPLINYATQQRTAPGSTYKMVVATAGLMEGVVNTNTLITCLGSFTEITDTHNCWIYPGRHGALNLSTAIQKSCNYYFYTVGYRLSMDENNNYNSDIGLEKLAKYANMYGLGDKSGVEIEESAPQISNKYSVPSAIGQGTNNYTTVGLARYVTAVANSGTVYNLTLLDKSTDSEGNLIEDFNASIYNRIEMDESYWRAIHQGMRRVVEDRSYMKELPIEVAGKTGTAQQSRARADHGLFVCYAPYDQPKIAMAIRIANGYSSEYCVDTSKDIINYYFNIDEHEEIVTGTAAEISATGRSGD
ncbi:MAG: penicillin-binding protein [Lachnospiraceae bacterium]|nr:penicillin-binding protein [Lachnospiraceae bacterium]